MSSRVWFTSDTHFRHAMVARLRGFATVEEHDEAIVARWNETVAPDDLVWHLGDVGLGNEAAALACVTHLNGVKHLITGNHDRCWPGHRDARRHQRQWLDVFESVQAFARTRVGDHPVLLSHFPYAGGGDHTIEERYPQFRLPDLGGWLIHGHTHQDVKVDGPRQVHVGLDAWDLRPVSDTEVAKVILNSTAPLGGA